MKKKIDFNLAKEERLDNRIRTTMQREFPLPDGVAEAKNKAFAQIRDRQAKQEYANGIARKTKDRRHTRSLFVRGAGTFAAAAAVFSVVCISNPALAANIPLVGHIFEEIGSSLGFSGDYSKYAQPLTEDNTIQAVETGESETLSEAEANPETEAVDSAYSKTVNGVTMTLSEVYCNDAALYLSLLIENEEAFPETFVDQQGKQSIHLYEGFGEFSYNPEKIYLNNYLDGKFVDDHTYAAVMRVDLQDTETTAEISIPEEFTVKLDIPMLVGDLSEEQWTDIPEMPQELLDKYNAGLEENGLGGMDRDDWEVYENLTDEQKEIENKLYNEMYQEYSKLYPETAQYPNKYGNWWIDGPWDFEISVKKNHDDTIVKEINDSDENGLGVVSVTKTPFEITVETQEPDISESPSGAGYFTVALDADGDILPYGSDGNTNVWAIQDRDISRIDIYLCDYIEYMDELKGYYWSDTYETDKETKTFRQLLDERALHHTEVTFEE